MRLKSSIAKRLLSQFFGDGAEALVAEAGRLRTEPWSDEIIKGDVFRALKGLPSMRRLAAAGFVCIRSPNVEAGEKGLGVVIDPSFHQNDALKAALAVCGEWKFVELKA